MHTSTLTCVYTINDEKAFEEEHKRIMASFSSSKGKPWALTAISIGHEIHRLCLAEEAHNADRHDLLDEIFGLIDPLAFKTIEELNSY